ncbi:alkyl/aryl-sulfatase [Curvibacter lanceolatus]|uniref:alkyl/aryl-sulfatase n=1 Tax=Curvibacter lanceolatus TaxID=86182 RepID=UPI002353852E|nr:alkyl sulfatase dimerization domain-containing protein [Curvibacter lanceolatus]
MKIRSLAVPVALSLLALTLQSGWAQQPLPAQPATVSAQAEALKGLPREDRRDFEAAQRGFIASLPDAATIRNPDGSVAWTLKGFEFLQQERVPDTVNPSLWRQAQLNMLHGLFKVTDRIYQIRGFDLANMTIIEGDSGLIVVDPLTTDTVAAAGLALYREHRGNKPVKAVIYSHSHVDHYGGVKGVASAQDVGAGRVAIYAPQGFMEEAVSENVLAGNAMSRRALFQFGHLLPRGERQQVDAGLGKYISRGQVTLIAPTKLITQPIQNEVIDGVQVEFQLTPGTEAPAEMHMYYPQLRALNMAENATHTLHNLYPLRGAQVRDANEWARYLNEARERYAGRADVMLAQHHWPTWGSAEITRVLGKQRDLYKFINDQTLHLLNQGYTPNEIAQELVLPPSLAGEWFARGYYGTVSHNARAVYQRYLGWYDANPAHLNPLPPQAAAAKWVAYMGGAEAVLAKARADFAKGEYRWVAEVVNQVVFSDPDNREARELQAATLEQMGYQAESATWRNAYLQGASELRNGVPKGATVSSSADVVQALSIENLFDFMGVRLDGQRAAGKTIVLNWVFTDTQQRYAMTLDNAALTYLKGKTDPQADATLTLPRSVLDAINTKQLSLRDAVGAGKVQIAGKAEKVGELLGLIDEFQPGFPVVTPRQAPVR